MTSRAATWVVMLSPAGRGAVATLLVEGPHAAQAVGTLFRPQNGRSFWDQPLDKIVFGRWQSADTGEELVVSRRDENRVEIHCHGGHAAASAIIASLVLQGCQEITWRQWVRESPADPIAAAARIELAAAPTRRTAGILADQYRGALRRALDELAATIASGDTQTALARVDELLAWSVVGVHLVAPWQVVLAGLPNVGKSSLINALLGYERAIVHDVPGTTRDVVTGAAAIDGWLVELSDTAGLHASTDPIEAAGICLAQNRLLLADLVVLVFDASKPQSDHDRALADEWPRALHVWNKCDLVDCSADTEKILVSAKTLAGVEALVHKIAKRLVPRAPAAGQAIPFAPQHVTALRQIQAALSAGQVVTAAQLLAEGSNWTSSDG